MAMGTNQAGATLESHAETKHVSGPYPTPSASPVVTRSPAASVSPAPTPHKIDPKIFLKNPSFFKKW
jgi:hypothetical protein